MIISKTFGRKDASYKKTYVGAKPPTVPRVHDPESYQLDIMNQSQFPMLFHPKNISEFNTFK